MREWRARPPVGQHEQRGRGWTDAHGVAFHVLSEGGGPPRPQNRGWKDTVLVRDRTEIVARFGHPAGRETPFMFHCHILEHEDHGMMGKFTFG